MRRPNAQAPKPQDLKSTRMDSFKLQTKPTSRKLLSRNPKNSKSNFLNVALISTLLFALFLCYLIVGKNSGNLATARYGIVIDGGSTGTRMHVFRYRVEKDKPIFDFGKNGLASLRVNPGLSSFVEDPDSAGGSLMELLEFARGKIPREYWEDTEVRLMATAGLRMLDLKMQENILESCRRVLRGSGFRFQDDWAFVITGSDEGLYAWVVANYALGALGGDPLATTGIIELGGASAQITFASNDPLPPEFSRAIRIGNITYTLYSHSFLHYGQNVAYDLLRESIASREISTEVSLKSIPIDPCTPKGYSHVAAPVSSAQKNIYRSTLHSKGNFSECRSATLMLLQKGKEECSYEHCYLGSNYVPRLQGRFLATENFFHTSKFFGLRSRAFLSELVIAGQQFCGEDWSTLIEKYQPHEDEDLLQYCFSSAYIVALLHDSLGVSLDDERIKFASQVGDVPLDWALGAFILQTTADLEGTHGNWLSTVLFSDSHMFSLVAISILLLCLAWYVLKLRKPPLKIVYDLEKGKCIITRISR